ncbi:MAG: hypothetical protein WD827_06425 [Solirubrobacterales bacterium]
MVTAVVAIAVVGAAGVAQGEKTRRGDVLVTFNGDITPHALPRTTLAPASVWISSSIESTEGAAVVPPQLREIAIEINRAGRLFDEGLPTCAVKQIQPSTIKAARKICGGSIIGAGKVGLKLVLGGQPASDFHAKLLAFHVAPANGYRRLVAQVYGVKPPSAFVLVFKIRKQSGTYGTVIETTLPKSARRWAYITHFALKLRRIFDYEGKRRSYINAGCEAPEGFPGITFPFARASFTFEDGRRVYSTLTRECEVR